MYRVVLVGADDSSTSRHALRTGAQLAEQSQASLHVVTCDVLIVNTSSSA